MIRVVTYSGGKDSTALVLWMKEQGFDFRAVFCDTGWEHPLTMKYIEEMNRRLLGGGLIVLKSEKFDGMRDLVKKKGRVPSARARFCTEELKVFPMVKYLKSLDDEYLVYQGIRAEESKRRSEMKPREWSDLYDCHVERPLFDWTAKQVFDYLATNGIEPNPLYKLGAGRVGCFPCVMVNKRELKNVSQMLPEIWDRAGELETISGRTFFPPDYIPEGLRVKVDPKSGVKIVTVEDVRLYVINPNQKTIMDDEPMPSCMSIYNLCE